MYLFVCLCVYAIMYEGMDVFMHVHMHVQVSPNHCIALSACLCASVRTVYTVYIYICTFMCLKVDTGAIACWLPYIFLTPPAA